MINGLLNLHLILVVYGGQIGYNFQGGPWVAGVEADVSWSDLNGRHVSPFNADLRTKVEGLGSFTGRLGYSWAQSLVYGKAGVGWARDKHQDFFAGALLGQASDTRWGYTLGVGWEQALTPNLSAKLEYNYLDLGTERLTFSGGTLAPFPLDIDQQIHSLKVGVNYRFGPWPLPTR